MKELSLKTITAGNPLGEPLLVIHGWAMNSTAWQVVKADLEKDYLISWVDLPGHGVNIDVRADTLEDIVDLILPEITVKTHLLGWSLGGLVAQALFNRTPELIRSLTLVASTPRFSQTKDWLNAMPVEVLNTFAKNLQADVKTTIKRFIALQFMGIRGSKQLQRNLLESILATPPGHRALLMGLNILSTADFRNTATYSRLQQSVPQHWILAGRDRLVPKSVINDLKFIHPDAQITLLENAGHAPFMTHPNEFLLSFTQFIASLNEPA